MCYFLGAELYINAFFGEGTGPIYYDDFRCTGTESFLFLCPNGGLNMIGDCNGHADDAGVRCGQSKTHIYLNIELSRECVVGI